ncbi:MAG: MlaD family protein [Deltaproteobacteria bacterium]|jgi:phospholipid/cholesterol/gamma-HCH transport system substrate-binding protein/paraquat-inducible protein B|nr:MlaD family protein [Deltaproteobacteria bacterium]
MAIKANYLKIGVFTIIALVLLAAAVLYFGLSSAFKPEVDCQTFFDHTVQGLTEGAPVNFRGFRVGQVTKVTMPQLTASNGQLLVKVDFIVFPNLLSSDSGFSAEEARNLLERETRNKLRCFLSYQGVSGIGYLNLDYLEGSARQEAQPVESVDGRLLIPSARGAVLAIGDSLASVLRSLAEVDFAELNKAMTATMISVAKLSDTLESEVAGLNDSMAKALEEIGQASSDFSELTKMITSELGDLELSAKAKDMGQALRQLSGVLNQAEILTRNTRTNLNATLDNLRVMSENFRELSEMAKRYPSQVLFGQPPTEVRK